VKGIIGVLFAVILLAIAVTGCQPAASQPGIKPEPTHEIGVPAPPTPFTSIVQNILSNPEYYVGREVVVVGYYRGWNLLTEASGQSPLMRSTLR